MTAAGTVGKEEDIKERKEDVRRTKEADYSELKRLRWCHLINILGFSLTMSAKMEFLLKSMASVDFATLMSKNMMIMMAGRILTAPFITHASSVLGRLKIYYMIMISYVVTDILYAALPSVQCFSWITRFGFLSMGPYMQLAQLQVSDMFPDDPKRVAIENGKLGLSFVIASFAVPTLNRILYRKDRRFPFVFAALLHSAEFFVSFLSKAETLPVTDRKRWEDLDWKSMLNPFLFLNLFNSGTKLAVLSISQVFDLLVHSQSFSRISNLVRMETHGNNWSLAQRSMFETYSAFVMIPSFIMGGRVYQHCGANLSFFGSYLAETFRFYFLSLVRKPWQEFLVTTMLMLRQPGNTALNALLRVEAKKAGLDNSQLSSCMTNLVQIVLLVNGVVLNKLYFTSHKSGHPRRFYIFCAGFPIAQLAMHYWYNLGEADTYPPRSLAKRNQ